MPELPEVENVARGLRPLEGRKMSRLDVIDARVWFESEIAPESFAGLSLHEVARRGKYLVLRFSPKHVIVQHLRMTGKMLDDGSALLPAALRENPEGAKRFQLRARFHFENRPMVFFDPRRFGTLSAVRDEEAFFAAKGIAPDPIHQEPAARALFLKRLRESERPIKPFLLDQSLAAGIGNIYADEALHRVGVHPETPARKVKDPERLWNTVLEILAQSIAAGGSSIIDYVNAAGERGSFSSQHLVYGRDGDPCAGCGAAIRRVVLGGRSTHFCLKCQPRRFRR
jgi:formamidopyrimidine-DNA glycosylase